MDVRRSKIVKTGVVCAIVLAIAIGVFVITNIPDEKEKPRGEAEKFEEEVKRVEVNSYDQRDINNFLFKEATKSSATVREYIEGNNLSDLWVAVEDGNDINLLVVYNIPKSKFVWTEVSRKMPMGAKHPYSPALVRFTEDAINQSACVANISNIQGDIVICVGTDKGVALNAIREYAKRSMKCGEQTNCAVDAIDNALKRDANTTLILYVGKRGKVLRIYEPRENTSVIWYQGELINREGVR